MECKNSTFSEMAKHVPYQDAHPGSGSRCHCGSETLENSMIIFVRISLDRFLLD
jgi:hypothetical protein